MAGGLEITHVPYKGSAPMDTDLLGGQIVMAFDATPTAMPLAQSGKLHALGAGMLKRLAAMPDLPTLDEQGLKGYECYTWNAILAPAGTPRPIVDKLNAAINKALADPAVSSALEKGASRRRRAQRRRLPPISSRRSWRNGRRSSRRRARRWIDRYRDLARAPRQRPWLNAGGSRFANPPRLPPQRSEIDCRTPSSIGGLDLRRRHMRRSLRTLQTINATMAISVTIARMPRKTRSQNAAGCASYETAATPFTGP